MCYYHWYEVSFLDTPDLCIIKLVYSPPYISIIEISQEDGGPTIGQVACIPEASHVQLFNDSVVGFAARNGVDTYPYVAVWSTGKVYRLFSPSLNAISPLPLVRPNNIYKSHSSG